MTWAQRGLPEHKYAANLAVFSHCSRLINPLLRMKGGADFIFGNGEDKEGIQLRRIINRAWGRRCDYPPTDHYYASNHPGQSRRALPLHPRGIPATNLTSSMYLLLRETAESCPL